VPKSDEVVQALLSALRFWDKLGLSPQERKDVCALVLFEESDEARVDKGVLWVSSTDMKHCFGEHERGKVVELCEGWS